MKIDFGELLAGFLIGFILACWCCAHAFNDATKEACEKQGTVILEHDIYTCSKVKEPK